MASLDLHQALFDRLPRAMIDNVDEDIWIFCTPRVCDDDFKRVFPGKTPPVTRKSIFLASKVSTVQEISLPPLLL